MLVTIQFRRGSETLWGDANTVLASGEPGFDTTNKVVKIGDGVTPWDDLPFANRDAIEELIATTSLADAQVANAVAEGPLTQAELSATYEPKGLSSTTRSGLGFANISAMLASPPFYTAHRCGASIVPEQTLEGGDVALNLGVDILDFDANLLADGSVGIMHDDTIDRTTSGTGNTTALNAMQWKLLQSDAGAFFAPAWPNTLAVPLAGDVLTRFGGKAVLNIEAKTTSVITPLCDLIVARGLTDSVFVNTKTVANIAAIKAKGVKAYYYFPSAAATVTDMAAVVAAAPAMVELRSDLSDSQLATAVAACVAAGIPTMGGVAISRWERDRFLAAGCLGVVTDDPAYVMGVSSVRTSDTWASKTYGHGYSYSTTTQPRHTFVDTAAIAFAAGSQFEGVGEVSPVASGTAVTVAVDTFWATLPTDTSRHIDLRLGVSDRPWDGTSSKGAGITAFVRANGQMNLSQDNADGSSATLATKTTGVSAMVASDVHRYTLTRAGSNVTFTDTFTGFSISGTTTLGATPYVAIGKNATNGDGRLKALAVS